MKLRTNLLENQIKKAKESVELLNQCIAEYYRGHMDTVKDFQQQISCIDKEIDTIRGTAQLHWSMIESDFRTKFAALDLVARISLIADYAEDVALLLTMRAGSIPESIWPDFQLFLETVMASVTKLEAAILMARQRKAKECKDCANFLRMYEGAHMGTCQMDEKKFVPGLRDESSSCEVQEKEAVYEKCEAVSDAESAADRIERTLRGKIYRDEIELEGMGAMHLLKIVENYDMIANVAEDCATALKAMY